FDKAAICHKILIVCQCGVVGGQVECFKVTVDQYVAVAKLDARSKVAAVSKAERPIGGIQLLRNKGICIVCVITHAIPINTKQFYWIVNFTAALGLVSMYSVVSDKLPQRQGLFLIGDCSFKTFRGH